MSSHPSTCDECKSISEGKGNFTFKMNKDQKAYVDSDLKFIPGHCKEGCLFYLEHLNYCAAFDFICSQDGYAPECFYNNLNEDNDEE
jgi:heterodisulfide reductase subunit A-like polyferredoxin